jgi:hypothetical protein
MNLKKIKKNTALKFLRKHAATEKIKPAVSGNIIYKVGILAEEDLFNTYDFRKELSENFKIPANDFKILLFQKRKNIESLHDLEYFSFDDFGFFGKIKGENVKDFTQNNFDLLINYCAQDNILALVASFQSNAILKAGFKMEEFNLYDISISVEVNKIDTFNAELTKYLQILNLIKQ